MKRRFFAVLLLSAFALFAAVPVAQAQFKLAAQKVLLADTIITPPDATVLATNFSPEILALDVPPNPSSGFLLFTGTAVWSVSLTANAPLRANFQLRFNITSPALPSGIGLRFAVPLTNILRTNNGSGVGFEGGTANDTEVLSRKFFADFLLAQNNALTADTATEIADQLFRQGFHVSVLGRLTSRNISDATVTNPNVAFFAQSGSQNTAAGTKEP